MSGREQLGPSSGVHSWGREDDDVSSTSSPGTDDIQLTDHDVLSGRGINISQFAGNERFRALVNSRRDASFCTTYTLAEKRAVAEEIIAHIQTLNPPGRFLKRPGRSKNLGLDGPWVELSKEEIIKKTCQALRDCNRSDRAGYGAKVEVPEDVEYQAQLRSQSGLTNKELAERAAALVEQQDPTSFVALAAMHPLGKRERDAGGEEEQDAANEDLEPTPIGETPSASLPPIEHAAQWLTAATAAAAAKKTKRMTSTPAPAMTPATEASTGGLAEGTHHHLRSSGISSSSSDHHNHHLYEVGVGYTPVADAAATLLSSHGISSPPRDHRSFQDPFEEEEEQEDSKPAAVVDSADFVDPLHMAAMEGGDSSGGSTSANHQALQDFDPPSPMGGHDQDDLHDHNPDPF